MALVPDKPKYRNWRDVTEHTPNPKKINANSLLIHGKQLGRTKDSFNCRQDPGSPGTGKTILASFAIRELQDDDVVQDQQARIVYFFFSIRMISPAALPPPDTPPF